MRLDVLNILLIIFLISACDTQQTGEGESPPDTLKREPSKTDTAQWATYRNEKFHFNLKHPQSWKVEVVNKAFPLISIYNTSEEVTKHPELHADATLSFINLFPKGLGTELPFGKQMSIREYEAEVPVEFKVDPIKSKAFLLENGNPWGFFLKPAKPPQEWEENGFLFAQMAVENYSTRCIDKESEKSKPMEECDPMMGDKIKKYGSVTEEQREIIRNILQSIHFTGEKVNGRKPITDLIQVEQPNRNASIKSPLQIKGKARGYWYFEGTFPVVLIDKNDKRVASGVAEAKGEWMSEDFVPFEVKLKFDTPKAQRGYLIFKKANPSGRPENDRSFRLPVIFE